MVPDSPLTARAAARLVEHAPELARLSASDGRRIVADIAALELTLAIIDTRFERLAGRPDDAYRAWRRDLLGRMRSLAQQARALEAASALEPHRRARAAAVLVTLRRRVAALDANHERWRDRRVSRTTRLEDAHAKVSP